LCSPTVCSRSSRRWPHAGKAVELIEAAGTGHADRDEGREQALNDGYVALLCQAFT